MLAVGEVNERFQRAATTPTKPSFDTPPDYDEYGSEPEQEEGGQGTP
jgi:hypothetical protein